MTGANAVVRLNPIPVDLARCHDRFMTSSAKFGADGEKWLQVTWRAKRGKDMRFPAR